MKRNTADIVEYKNMFLNGRDPFCESCGIVIGGKRSKIQGHHIHPVMYGGKEDVLNIILLCPNHHAIAHMIAYIHKQTHDGWIGPTKKESLLNELAYYHKVGHSHYELRVKNKFRKKIILNIERAFDCSYFCENVKKTRVYEEKKRELFMSIFT